MSNPYRKFNPGDRLQTDPRLQNVLVDVAADFVQRTGGFQNTTAVSPRNNVLLITGEEPLAQFSIVGLAGYNDDDEYEFGSLAITQAEEDASFRNDLVWNFADPVNEGAFAILQEPMPPGGVAPALAQGISRVQVYMTIPMATLATAVNSGAPTITVDDSYTKFPTEVPFDIQIGEGEGEGEATVIDVVGNVWFLEGGIGADYAAGAEIVLLSIARYAVPVEGVTEALQSQAHPSPNCAEILWLADEDDLDGHYSIADLASLTPPFEPLPPRWAIVRLPAVFHRTESINSIPDLNRQDRLTPPSPAPERVLILGNRNNGSSDTRPQAGLGPGIVNVVTDANARAVKIYAQAVATVDDAGAAIDTVTLASDIDNSTTSITVTGGGLSYDAPFAAVIDEGLANEEWVDVSAISGSTWTVARGQYGSAAAAHTAGANVTTSTAPGAGINLNFSVDDDTQYTFDAGFGPGVGVVATPNDINVIISIPYADISNFGSFPAGPWVSGIIRNDDANGTVQTITGDKTFWGKIVITPFGGITASLTLSGADLIIIAGNITFTSGGTISGCLFGYTAANPTDWAGSSPPTDLAGGVDRCAALLKVLNGGTGP